VKALLGLMVCCSAMGADTRQTATHKRVKAALDAVPAIDTHDHLWPFETLPGYVETERGHGMNLSSIWRNSYYSGLTRSRNGRRRPSAELEVPKWNLKFAASSADNSKTKSAGNRYTYICHKPASFLPPERK